MDSESCRENEKKGLNGDNCIDVSNIFQPIGVRRSICLCDEIDRFLLDYGYYFLPNISTVIYLILFLKETF
jgi:hypothetical protein